MAVQTELSSERDGKFLVSKLTLKVPNLPAALQGFRLVQLTDFHYGPATPLSHIAQAAEITAALKPNMLLLTGDYVHRDAIGVRHYLARTVSPKYFRWLAYRRDVRELTKSLSALLATIPTTDGVVAIHGNHEYCEGEQTIARHLGKNIEWLHNTSITIERDGATLQLAGIEDLRRGKPDIEKSVQHMQQSSSKLAKPAVRILLSHSPDIVIRARPELLAPFDLILSGHTHGGQFCLPFYGPIITRTHQREHVQGLSQFNNSHVYVSNGVGYGMIQLRIFCPPEIVVVELAKKG